MVPEFTATEAVVELPVLVAVLSKQTDEDVQAFANATAVNEPATDADGVIVMVSAPEFVSYNHQMSVLTLVPFATVCNCVKLVAPIFTVLMVWDTPFAIPAVTTTRTFVSCEGKLIVNEVVEPLVDAETFRPPVVPPPVIPSTIVWFGGRMAMPMEANAALVPQIERTLAVAHASCALECIPFELPLTCVISKAG